MSTAAVAAVAAIATAAATVLFRCRYRATAATAALVLAPVDCRPLSPPPRPRWHARASGACLLSLPLLSRRSHPRVPPVPMPARLLPPPLPRFQPALHLPYLASSSQRSPSPAFLAAAMLLTKRAHPLLHFLSASHLFAKLYLAHLSGYFYALLALVSPLASLSALCLTSSTAAISTTRTLLANLLDMYLPRECLMSSNVSGGILSLHSA